jgi:ribosomal protein S6--L-glutamate ligase
VASGARLDVGLLVERRYLAQAQPAGLAAALTTRGHRVHLVDPGSRAFRLDMHRWPESLDLVIARGRSWELLCLLAWAESRGVPTINHRAAIGAVHNKAEMAVVLENAGIPTPCTCLAPAQALDHMVQACGVRFPLVLKPIFGDNGRGLRVVRDRAELATVQWPEAAMLVQELLPSDGYDRKIYGIGDEIWVVMKPSPLAAATAAGALRAPDPAPEPVPVMPGDHELAARCRRAFGLELYGIDCIETPQGAVVIEVNDFPNYTGVPRASERMAEHVLYLMQRALRTGRRR